MPLSETVLITSGLLTVAMIAAGLCRDWPVPYTVILVVTGMLLGELSRDWAPLAPLQEFRLSPELVFFIFLPALIFESGFNLDARQLVKDLAPILVMAIPALLISTALIGAGLWLILGLDLIIALLFGALISATDPVAVVALFKELGAPLRLNVLVEGESLLNDATAIVVFSIILGIVLAGGTVGVATAGWAILEFFRVFLGGALVGAVVGLVVGELLYRLRSGLTAILVMSIVMAYASFIIAEHVLHVSGVMAAVAAAVGLHVFGVTRMPQRATAAIGETWELIALICNSLLFLLVGLSVEPVALGSHIGPIAIAVVLVLLARAAAVYSLVPFTTRLFALPRVSPAERHIIWWGGLKGGLAIAIVLSIPESLAERDLLLKMTLGVVLFTLLVNAPSIRPLMVRLGLDRLSGDERAELNQSLASARRQAETDLDHLHDAGLISRAGHYRIRKAIAQTLEVDPAEAGGEHGAREVYLAAIRTELDELTRLHALNVISQYTFLNIRNTLQRDREAHSASGTMAATVSGGTSPFERLEMLLLRRLREHDWAARLLSRYQNLRLSQRLQHNIAGILMCQAVLDVLRGGPDFDPAARDAIAAVYEDRLARRRARVDAIRKEFPAFYERFESRLMARMALISAARNAEQAHHHGEIGAKVHARIERRLRAALAELPPLSVPLPRLQAKELIEMIPLLAGLPEEALTALAAHARPVTFLQGDVVIGEGERGDALYIITRGHVSVTRRGAGGEPLVVGSLGEGGFFGEMALLGDPLRTATVTASTPATLLRLARRDVVALAGKHPEVQRRLNEAVAARAAGGSAR